MMLPALDAPVNWPDDAQSQGSNSTLSPRNDKSRDSRKLLTISGNLLEDAEVK
jgi:hypothetical protein